MAEIITHAAFYAGWPNAWAVFKLAKEVYAEDNTIESHGGMFGMGEPNTAFAKYFTGNSYLKPLTNPKDCSLFWQTLPLSLVAEIIGISIILQKEVDKF